jgi:hypothetical protein
MPCSKALGAVGQARQDCFVGVRGRVEFSHIAAAPLDENVSVGGEARYEAEVALLEMSACAAIAEELDHLADTNTGSDSGCEHRGAKNIHDPGIGGIGSLLELRSSTLKGDANTRPLTDQLSMPALAWLVHFPDDEIVALPAHQEPPRAGDEILAGWIVTDHREPKRQSSRDQVDVWVTAKGRRKTVRNRTDRP